MTTAEAAEELNITPRAIRRLLVSGKLEGHKHGRDWVVFADSVEEYARSIEGKSKNDPTR